MQRIYRLTLCLLVFSLTSLLSAQACFYELQMSDSFGDGWNGGELTITAGDQAQVFTLTNTNSNGLFLSVCFSVTDGEDLVFGYESGAFANEVSFSVFNSGGELILQENNGPAVGDTIFQTVVSCDVCTAPSFCGDITFDRLRSNSVDFNWNTPGGTDGNLPAAYLIEFDTLGFTQGTGNFRTTTDTMFRIQPLMDTTTYTVYIATLCSDGDTSSFRGPYTFTTPFTNDVGVSIVTDPISGCDVGVQQIRVGLQNFGGRAQSFIPFDYTINGFTSGVAMPQDGLYTGVLGVDSIEFTTFDIFADFSVPGTYELKIWTALAGDQDPTNDTLTVEIVSTEVLEELPYFEEFETSNGGWVTAQDGTGAVSWEYGIPMGNLISGAAQGQYAWVTNLDGPYNNSEVSYLLSPCFDFSDLTEDPIIHLSLFVDTENGFDELFLESSIDNVNWERVGTAGTGLNWYNDPLNNWWEDDGGFGNNWVLASQNLAGLAGQPRVRLRFVFSSDGSVVREGVGIDNVYVGPRLSNDLSATALNNISPVVCGTTSDSLVVTFFNLGSTTAENITLSYQLNGGNIVTENYPDTLPSFTSATYQFETPYDATQSTLNVIQAWTNLNNDGLSQNDTVTLVLQNSFPLPFYEGFDDSQANGWTLDDFELIAEGHGSGSIVLFDNLWGSDQTFTAITPNVGLVETGDTLFFDYRFVDFSSEGATQLSNADSFIVSLNINCDPEDVIAFTLTGANHTPTVEFQTAAISLEQYVGSSVQATFRAVWASGDYFIDLDNVNIRRCAASFEPALTVTNATTNGSSDGAVALELGAGVAPFSFAWSNGDETPNLTNVPTGTYAVTISDAQGCTETLTVEVGFTVNNRNFGTDLGTIAAAPNPTTGNLEILINLNESSELRIQLINQLGQTIETRTLGNQRNVRERFELTGQPAGMYFVRVFAGEQYQTLRVIKQ